MNSRPFYIKTLVQDPLSLQFVQPDCASVIKQPAVGNEDLLTEDQIFSWASEYRRAIGSYPKAGPVRVTETVATAYTTMTWERIDYFLRKPENGFPEGLTLGLLIESHHRLYTPLSKKKILYWAKVHLRKKGNYPSRVSGLIDHPDAAPDTWADINAAMMLGQRGIIHPTTLEDLIAFHKLEQEDLSENKILMWVDAYKTLHGKYPQAHTKGTIPDSNGETWRSLDFALNKGIRGLSRRNPSDDLYWFINRHRIFAQRPKQDDFTPAEILSWAIAFVAKYGRFPDMHSGLIEGTRMQWQEINDALLSRTRGLAGRTTLADFLQKELRVAPPAPDVSRSSKTITLASQVNATDAFTYPSRERVSVTYQLSGPLFSVDESTEPEETVGSAPTEKETSSAVVPSAVVYTRVSPSDSASDQETQKSVRWAAPVPTFTQDDLLGWIVTFYAFERKLPDLNSGLAMHPSMYQGECEPLDSLSDANDIDLALQAPAAPTSRQKFLTWRQVHQRLVAGWMDVPVGTTLAVYLKRYRFAHLPLTEDQILMWIDEHRRYSGEYPSKDLPDLISGANGECWKDIHRALRHGLRGLPTGDYTCTLEQFMSLHGRTEKKLRIKNQRGGYPSLAPVSAHYELTEGKPDDFNFGEDSGDASQEIGSLARKISSPLEKVKMLVRPKSMPVDKIEEEVRSALVKASAKARFAKPQSEVSTQQVDVFNSEKS